MRLSRHPLPLPPPATPQGPARLRGRWLRTCALLVVPGTAVLHHALFFPRTCVWVPFEGESNRTTDLKRFLREDASLAWAVALASATYRLGLRRPKVQRLCAPLFTGLLPLSLWIWDVPFTRRAVCRHLHDGNLAVGGLRVRSAHVYSLSAALYAALLALRTRGEIAEAPGMQTPREVEDA